MTFPKCTKEKAKKKKIKNVGQTLWAVVPMMARQIQLKFGKGVAHPRDLKFP